MDSQRACSSSTYYSAMDSQKASSSSTYYSVMDSQRGSSSNSVDVERQNECSNLRELARLPREFCYQDLNAATNNFRDKLGSGGSGSVFKGVLENGTMVAVKRVERPVYGVREFEAEISAIASVQHVHLVRLRGYCSHMEEKGRVFFIVYDLLVNGSLDGWIFPRMGAQNRKCLPWTLRYKVAIDVAKALAYLHHDCRPGILHLDIKPENILLDVHFRAVVSDFGFSKFMSKDASRVHTMIRGTPGYRSPDWFTHQGISEKCDIFSYGQLLLDLFFGQQYVCLDQNGNDVYRYGGNSKQEQRTFHTFMWEKLTQKNFMELIDKRLIEDGIVDEIEASSLLHAALSCLEEDPNKRPSGMRHVTDMLEPRKLDGIGVARFTGEFSYEDLKIARRNFQDKFGREGSNSVFQGILNDGTLVTVKIIERATNADQEFKEEISAIVSIQHAHLVRIRGYCNRGSASFIIYEYFPKGLLSDWIFPHRGRSNGPCLSWKLKFNVAVGVAKALVYLHHDCSPQLLHLDIKPDNILLDDNFGAVVSDFGLFQLMSKNESAVPPKFRGTNAYKAPEWLLDSGITEKCDVFSYGVLLLDMFFGERCICLDGNGNRNDKASGNSGEERLKFYRYLWSKAIIRGKYVELMDKRLIEDKEADEGDKRLMEDKKADERIARFLLFTALWCVQEDPNERPDMQLVVKKLEDDFHIWEIDKVSNNIVRFVTLISDPLLQLCTIM
ncbi:hypothetical protein GIB67_043015 [Kingdonia uniflora]|uniref:non-specific serine/threonine protein kinase n=1 Tax=Kingdonia uniflora TaxID=39325 RepID=A0A7J7NSZ8_9MAGN|nr:hypothetical protein GIB67_043015 [Kingdonia uniflora]